jgi:hypothetical protein
LFVLFCHSVKQRSAKKYFKIDPFVLLNNDLIECAQLVAKCDFLVFEQGAVFANFFESKKSHLAGLQRLFGFFAGITRAIKEE